MERKMLHIGSTANNGSYIYRGNNLWIDQHNNNMEVQLQAALNRIADQINRHRDDRREMLVNVQCIMTDYWNSLSTHFAAAPVAELSGETLIGISNVLSQFARQDGANDSNLINTVCYAILLLERYHVASRQSIQLLKNKLREKQVELIQQSRVFKQTYGDMQAHAEDQLRFVQRVAAINLKEVRQQLRLVERRHALDRAQFERDKLEIKNRFEAQITLLKQNVVENSINDNIQTLSRALLHREPASADLAMERLKRLGISKEQFQSVISNVYNREVLVFLIRFSSKLACLLYRAYAFSCLIEKMRSSNHLFTTEAILLTYVLHQSIVKNNSLLNHVKHNIPEGIKKLIFQPEVQIKNKWRNEHLYAADYRPFDHDRRRLFIWMPGGAVTQSRWRLAFNEENSTFSIFNTYHQEYMYAADYAPYDNERRRVFAWRRKNQNVSQGDWKIEPQNDGSFMFFNTAQREDLFAGAKTFDHERRKVFTWRGNNNDAWNGEENNKRKWLICSS